MRDGEQLPARGVLGELVEDLDLAAPYDLLEVCETWLRRRAGARASELLLVDYGQTVLEPVPRTDRAAAGPPHLVQEGSAGAAYREQRMTLDHAPERAATVAYLPVTIRTERLGVLSVALDPGPPLEATLLMDAARVLAHVLAGARRYTDRYEMLRRRKDLGLAAEIQWELLPVLAYELPAFSIAGALEPTYDIGGDTFDYAASATGLTITVTDAVGHGLRAALLGSLAVTAMRNARRGGGGIDAQAAAANRHLVEQFPGPQFVTGLLLEVDVPHGSVHVLNAGHPPPLLLRDDTVETVSLTPDLPLGLDRDTAYRRRQFQLRAGDRLLLVTDGITEAHHRGRPAFGSHRVAELLTGLAHLPPAEFVRRLTRAVLDHRGGDLADDATAVCLDWTSEPPPATPPGRLAQPAATSTGFVPTPR